MATTFIAIDTTQRLGSDARREIDRLRASLEGMSQLTDILPTMIDGTDYSLLETQLGLETGEGETFYNLFVGAQAAIDVSAVTQLLNRCG